MALLTGERIFQGGVRDADGRAVVALASRSTVKYAVINPPATATANTIVAAVTGKKIVVLSYTLVAAGAITVTWRSDATLISGPLAFAANGGTAPATTPEAPLLETAAGQALILLNSAAVQVGGHLTYIEV